MSFNVHIAIAFIIGVFVGGFFVSLLDRDGKVYHVEMPLPADVPVCRLEEAKVFLPFSIDMVYPEDEKAMHPDRPVANTWFWLCNRWSKDNTVSCAGGSADDLPITLACGLDGGAHCDWRCAEK